MTTPKAQRIRDPVHNLIEFGKSPFDQMIWQVIQTEPFQRLRRIRQLGFSEFVFPGATHTRFSHSIGVFQTARQLMEIIKLRLGDEYNDSRAKPALAAALVHDLGHGMFSHSFEEVGKILKLKFAKHETVSEALIANSEVSACLDRFSDNFSRQVADIVKAKVPINLYNSVVSSQFDADRLDYMQRDRLMTGVESSGIDSTWLMANLEIGHIPASVDNESLDTINTLVLGRKAFHVAENYVLSLFHLYPNVYFHKTTRAAEKVFSKLLIRVFKLVQEGHEDKIGLHANNPIVRFASEPDSIENALCLDDSVFWAALPYMLDATDSLVANHASSLRRRKLPKCFDVRQMLEQDDTVAKSMPLLEKSAEIKRLSTRIAEKFEDWADARTDEFAPPVFIDRANRSPYNKYDDSQSLLSQILIKQDNEALRDMADISPVVAGAKRYEVCRIYLTADDSDSKNMLKNIIGTIRENDNGAL